MADNVTFQTDQLATPPDGLTVATDDVGGVDYQRIKIDLGGDGVSTPLVGGQQAESSSISVVKATPSGQLLGADSNGSTLDADATGTIYALLSIRRQSGETGTITLHSLSATEHSSKSHTWMLIEDATIADTFTYVAESGSIVEIARGATANTVTGGKRRYNSTDRGGNNALEILPENRFKITDDTKTYTLCVRTEAANAEFWGVFNWEEPES